MTPLQRFRLWALPPDSRIGHLARIWWRHATPRRPHNWHAELFQGLAESRPDVRFVQIGSNDAGYGDPLRVHVLLHGWRGLMVEPVPYIYQRLVQRYASIKGLRFANVAIAERSGSQTFFHLRASSEASLPPWYDQLGSFDRAHLMKHQRYLPDLPDRIVESTVECMRFDDLCAGHGIDGFDLLHIDTEGYDWKVLQTVDLARYRPTIVLFEHRHLAPTDLAAALAHLHQAGYRTHNDMYDSLAVRVADLGQDDGIDRAWHRLRSAVGVAAQAPHSGPLSAESTP